jgi:hypothetical protein
MRVTRAGGGPDRYTLRQASDDDDGLQANFLLLIQLESSDAITVAINLPLPPLPARLVAVQDAGEGRDDPETDPAFLSLVMPDYLVFQSSQGSQVVCRRRGASKLGQDRRSSWPGHARRVCVCVGVERESSRKKALGAQ